MTAIIPSTRVPLKDAWPTEDGNFTRWLAQAETTTLIRIALFKNGVDPSDEKQYPELHAWMLANMDRFRKVFAARIKSLLLGATDEGEEPPEE
jgi:hypothetical protein